MVCDLVGEKRLVENKREKREGETWIVGGGDGGWVYMMVQPFQPGCVAAMNHQC